jgi:RHS repeat-associated protein
MYYQYDVSPTWITGLTNLVGRLVQSYNQFAGTAGQGTDTVSSYDAMGRIVEQWQQTPVFAPGGNYLNYSYDLAGDMLTYTNGAGVTFAQSVDTAGRVTGVTSNFVDSQHPATLATVDPSLGYYPHGGLRKMVVGNGLTQTAAFNKTLEPCRINLNSSAAALGTCTDAIPSGNLQDFNYGFNSGTSNNGNVMTWAGSGQRSFNRTYAYDSLNRLSTLSSPSDPNGCSGLSWSYDAWGNRTAQTTTGGSCPQQPSTTFSLKNQLPSPYAYDAAGNMTYDGTHYYFYDAENRLIQVQSTPTLGACSAASACYVYDALGRRVHKSGSLVPYAIDYMYDLQGNVMAEYEPACSGGTECWSTGYVYLNGALTAEYKNATTYFASGDHLGSARIVTALNQTVVQNLDYLPFGELNSSDSGVNTHEFTGDEQDAETALAHTLFRQYSSSIGRWMTPDPAGLAAVDPTNPQSWNRYAYVLNNPINFIDRSGPGCSYFTDDSNEIESVDYNSSQSECDATGGSYVPDSNGEFGPCDPGAICVDAFGSAGDNGGGFGMDPAGFSSQLGNIFLNAITGTIRDAYCSEIPSGRATSVSVAAGGVGSVSGSLDTVVNYNSGQTSVFATGGGALGWNGGGNLTTTTGLVYGLDGTNNGFSGPFKGGNFYAPTPIPGVGAGGSITHAGGVTVASVGVSGALAGKYGFGGSWTNTTNPANVGGFTGFTTLDYLGYLLRRPCS